MQRLTDTLIDTTKGVYKVQLTADTTKLNMTLLLAYKMAGTIDARVLAPDELPGAPNTAAKFKAVSIVANSDITYYLKSADIVIPYALSDLKGYPEHRLGAFWLNDTTNQWVPISSSIDSLKHQITVHGAGTGTYGVFVKSNTAIGGAGAMLATANGIKANFMPQKQSIAVHLSLLKAAHAEVCVYDIQGKCVKKSSFEAHQGLSTLMLNSGTLGNGKYFLTLKAGSYCAKEPILIMK